MDPGSRPRLKRRAAHGGGPAGAAAAPLLFLFLAAILLAGCAGGPRSGDGRPGVRDARLPAAHVVRKGDTLSAIAWRYGLDYRSIAGWNGIPPPYLIHPGQRLRLRGATPRATAAASGGKKPAKPGAAPRGAPPAAPVKGWTWPAEGKLLNRFDGAKHVGIDIAGRRGQPVKAAAAGRVVYVGTGLVGYGRVVIIKHNRRLLSAYGHNRRNLVKEGQTVRAGQKIAEMGSTGADRVKLRFEVRRDGKPRDPLGYLPR